MLKPIHRYPTKENRRLYAVYCTMKRRCYSPSHSSYHHYGGRGIKVCTEWLENWDSFAEWAYSSGYNPDATYGECMLDRIDVNSGYSADNCRWANAKEQARNRRNNTLVGGKCLAQVAEDSGLSKWTIQYRVSRGISIERPTRKPIEMVEGKTLKEIAKVYGVSYNTIYHRFTKGARTIVNLITPKRVKREVMI